MNTGMQIKSTIAATAMNHWHYIEPYAKVPETKAEYQKQELQGSGVQLATFNNKS